MKTLTKSLIVAALAASSVSTNAAVATFSGVLTQVGTPSTSYSGSFSGSYDTTSNVLSLTGVAVATLVTFSTPGTPAPLTTGKVTAAGGYSANLSLNAGSISSTTQSVTIPTVGTYTFAIANQGTTASLYSQAAAGNTTTPTVYTISLNNASGTVLTGTFTAVPEPEVYAGVAALGLAGFALWRRRNA